MNPFSGAKSRDSDTDMYYPYPPPWVRKHRGNRLQSPLYIPIRPPPSRSCNVESKNHVPKCPKQFVEQKNQHLRRPATLATGRNKALLKQGLIKGCFSVPPAFGLIAPPTPQVGQQDLLRDTQSMPNTIPKSARGQGDDKEVKRKDTLAQCKPKTLLVKNGSVETVANCKPILMSVGKVKFFQRQTDLPQKKLGKEKAPVVTTTANCETRKRNVNYCTANFNEKIAKLHRPTYAKVKSAKVEKNKLKPNPGLISQGNSGNENRNGSWREGIAIQKNVEWKQSNATPKMVCSTLTVNSTYGNLDNGRKHATHPYHHYLHLVL